MTDEELLQRARSAVPESLRGGGVIVRRLGIGALEALTPPADPAETALLQDLERLLEMQLPRKPDADANCVDVAFHADSAIGRRTTVVQIRNGEVKRVIAQA